ncbi:MAG: hypothetical protein AAFQ35_10090, partial [Pseudomonadota bacterium]
AKAEADFLVELALDVDIVTYAADDRHDVRTGVGRAVVDDIDIQSKLDQEIRFGLRYELY